ncbi:MAG: NUDIX domain-containing protein [Patescibacteria group bacterium]
MSSAVEDNRKTRSARKQPRVRVEISAGGIVFKRTPKGVRLAFIMDPYGKWTFAKGHPEVGETIVDAALRETREEMGLGRLKIIKPVGKIDIWFRDRYRPETKGMLVHKHVHYFLMEAPAHAKGRPQFKEKIRKIIWVPLRRALDTSSYKDVRPVLERVTAHFSNGRRPAAKPPSPEATPAG